MDRFLRGWTWSIGFGFDPAIDFCLWVLERDGLPVPPFGRHGGGDGALRAAGLHAAGWRRWFARVVAAAAEWDRHPWQKFRQLTPPPRPAALWDGDPALGRRLESLAEKYEEEIWGEREARRIELAHIYRECDDLWKRLAPFRRRLPPLRVVAVSYPGPLYCAMPPDTVVLAVGNWQPSPPALTAAILDGARSLSQLRGSKRSAPPSLIAGGR